MAESPVLTDFCPGDRFLRRVGLSGQIKNGLVHWRAFKERDPTYSLTFQDESLSSDEALDSYREHFSRHIGGNLPGILWLSFDGLTDHSNPPLIPRSDPDADDLVYGHLHCVIDSPREREQMELLAKLVNDGEFGAVLREFVTREARE